MISCLPAEVFNRISNYIVQNELIELLVKNGFAENWDAKFSSNDYEDDDNDDEEEENEDEDKEEIQVKEPKKEEYRPWQVINKWITLAWIEGFVEMNEIRERKICYIKNNLGFWIGVNSIYKDDIIKELIDIFYDYQVSNEEFKALKEWKDIFPKEKIIKE